MSESKNNRVRKTTAGAASLTLAIGTAALSPAVSQAQSSENSPPVDENTSGLTEIVVTAQRRTENLQRVALSATVFDAKDLKQEGIITIQNVAAQTPGLSIQPSVSSETYINIRGVGIQETAPTSSNGVAFYIDGMYIPSLIDVVDTFYDLSNVEVLRGPQGTLVGSNSDGGAIFVNSAQPSFDKVKGYFEQTFGNYNDRRSEGAINIPLSDEFAARAAFVYETRDSFTHNVGVQPPDGTLPSGQSQPGNLNFEAMRLQLTYKPNESFQTTLRYEPYQSKTDGYALKPDESTVSPTSPYYDPYAASIQNRPYVIDYNVNQYTNIVGQRTSLTSVWHITDGIEAKSVSSYQTGYESDLTDLDGSSAPDNIYLVRRPEFRTLTQEFNILSTSSSAFQWVAGAYYLNQRDPLSLSFVNFPNPPVAVLARHQNEAVFASGTYTFTPQWSFTLGGRYSWDSLPYTEYMATTITTPLHTSKPTGTAKLNYQVTPDTLIYASVATGYKAGSVNLQIPGLFTPPPAPPETNVVEELGLKTTLFDNHLRFAGDVFKSKYSHYQLQEANPIGLPLDQGPGDANIYGVEAEFTGAFDAWQFNLGASYLHATVSDDFTFVLPDGTPTIIAKGTPIPYAPRWMINAGVQYDIHLPQGVLTPRLQYSYQALQYVNIGNRISADAQDVDDILPSHGIADFRLTYAANNNWDIEGFVNNIASRTYVSAINISPIGVTPTVEAFSAPRTFGARLTYKF